MKVLSATSYREAEGNGFTSKTLKGLQCHRLGFQNVLSKHLKYEFLSFW